MKEKKEKIVHEYFQFNVTGQGYGVGMCVVPGVGAGKKRQIYVTVQSPGP